MQAVRSQEQERIAFQHVLESGLFDKAPRLGRFFQYVCELYFEGHADQIKEYSIALEALGRSPDFDPKKDSIVRVEAHRLRRRLEDYYKGRGAAEQLQIVIPNGQYRPHFVNRETFTQADELGKAADPVPECLPDAATVLPSTPSIPPMNSQASASRSWLKWTAVAAAVLLIAAAISIGVTRPRPQRPVPATNEVWTGGSTPPVGPEMRILAGYHGSPYIDRQGHTWYADAFFQGGTSKAMQPGAFIEGQPDPRLLRSSREGHFRYDIPLVEGPHEMHLFFVETEHGIGPSGSGGEGTRTFRLRINDETIQTPIDPVADAGARNRLSERVFKDITAGSDRKLHLEFQPIGGAAATLSAIEILPSVAGRIHPIRLVAQPNPVTDSEGRVWAADEFFCGGMSVMRGTALLNRCEKALYRGERYGNFAYRIPLAPGRYALTLYFAEQWWGAFNGQMEPVTNRRFDVFANRQLLLHDFIVGDAAGGSDRSVKKTFENLQPNAQGLLLLEFVPSSNYAEVNAIEVVNTD